MSTLSVTDIEERALVKWLFTGPTVPVSLSSQLHLGPVHRLGLALPTKTLFPGVCHPGDIDVLIQHDVSAANCTAIEFKRVKVKAETFQNGSPNKIADLRKGVHQVNDLYELGFSSTVLLVAIVTDGRTRVQANFVHRGPTAQQLVKIWDFSGRESLHDEVGLGFVEIVQPVDKPIDMAGRIGAYMVKVPRRRTQRLELGPLTRAFLASSRGSSLNKGLELQRTRFR